MGFNKSRVAYCYDENIGNYHYGPGHPMKPLRVKMCHNLVMNYDLFKSMNIIEHKPASKERLTQYHSEDYINFLEKINPKNAPLLRKELSNFNVGEDCPVFEGIYDYNALAAGGTIEAVAQLNHNKADIAINWSGGLHHAKRCEASGFCYVNDIVLGILELLRYHPKVLYIDIDVHHGDGVEEAFFATDRVMTLSFHKFGEFFPGTGDLRDIGYGEGKYHSINVPLRSGIDDATFQQIFEPVTRACIEWYNPSAIVLQCGADSLAGDRLGCFNLSATGHSNCVKFVKSLNLPMLVLGGGGYTVRNVARCWTKETGVILDQDLDNKLPINDYYDFYGPEYQLEVEPVSIENLNTRSYIQSITEKVINNIKRCQINPNVQLHETPGDLVDRMDVDDDEDNPDIRINKRLANTLIAHDNEYFGGKYDANEKDKSGYNLDSTPTGSRADPESDEESQASNSKSDTPAERTFSRRPTLGMSAQWDGFHTVHSAPAQNMERANSPSNFQDTSNAQSPIFFVGSPQENGSDNPKPFNGETVSNGNEHDTNLSLSPTNLNLNSNTVDEDKSSRRSSRKPSPTTRRSPRIMQQNLNTSPNEQELEQEQEQEQEKEQEQDQQQEQNQSESKQMDWEAIDKELDWSMNDNDNTNANNEKENENPEGEEISDNLQNIEDEVKTDPNEDNNNDNNSQNQNQNQNINEEDTKMDTTD